MGKVTLILLLICAYAFLLTGCAIHTHFYLPDDQGNMEEVAHVKQGAQGLASYKRADLEMSVDTRQVSWWDRYVTPVLMGGAGRTNVQAGAGQ